MTSAHDTAGAAFISELTEAVSPLDRDWVVAFEKVPRGVFVPYFFQQGPPDWRWRIVEPPDPEWTKAIYSRRPLGTQIDGDDSLAHAARREPVNGRLTSSSSAPTLMAQMLQALDVCDGDRVLEIGTGSGYNAALLCHRLGADQVTSIDVDSGLVEAARTRLASIGYRPHLAAVDGVHGVPERAPFDKIIATVSLAELPQTWRKQIAPSGTILLPLPHGGLIARLDVDEAGVAQGRFLSTHGYFMTVRDRRNPRTALGAEGGETRSTELPVGQLRRTTSNAFESFLALRTGGFGWAESMPDNGDPAEVWLTRRDGSWVCHTEAADGRMQVRQGGPRRLWDEIEAAHEVWTALGEPTHDRFGLTVTPDGTHRVWLDNPDTGHAWELPTP
jgi:methyltransferase of ATP-grasp peptide maturase system